MKLKLKIWRQENATAKGSMQTYSLDGVSPDMSFLEMMDVLNEQLMEKGIDPVAFDHDCREGICGSCSMFINGEAHGPDRLITTCQLHMRKFKDGDTIHIGSHKIRLQGINAPELDEPYGKQAKWALHKLVKGQTITAQPNGEKSYDRIVAKCFLEDGRDLAAEMVKMELALDLPNYPDADYKHLETPASRKKLKWKPKKKTEN